MNERDSTKDAGQDVGFRVADALSAQVKECPGLLRPKQIVTNAIRRGLAQMLREPAPTISQLAMDAGFTQYHAQLATQEIVDLHSLSERVKTIGKRKTPMRFVLRECLVRGLQLSSES